MTPAVAEPPAGLRTGDWSGPRRDTPAVSGARARFAPEDRRHRHRPDRPGCPARRNAWTTGTRGHPNPAPPEAGHSRVDRPVAAPGPGAQVPDRRRAWVGASSRPASRPAAGLPPAPDSAADVPMAPGFRRTPHASGRTVDALLDVTVRTPARPECGRSDTGRLPSGASGSTEPWRCARGWPSDRRETPPILHARSRASSTHVQRNSVDSGPDNSGPESAISGALIENIPCTTRVIMLNQQQ